MNWTVLATGDIVHRKDGCPGMVLAPWHCDTDTIAVLTPSGMETWSVYDVCVQPNK